MILIIGDDRRCDVGSIKVIKIVSDEVLVLSSVDTHAVFYLFDPLFDDSYLFCDIISTLF